MSDIEIEIDGKKLQAKPDAMVIQVADEAGIYIPRFCYHKHLTIAANCRMCLVEVEKSPKTLPACATPVTPGMKVFTRSAKAIAAQKAVMEFLLINHPLDCPICDQGGECELQDISMGYGSADSFYNEGKRSFKDKDLGPLISSEMTRCIQCTRCVRFGDEIAGLRELGAIDRGEKTEIGTYVQHALRSEISGNIIDLCPVGALTSKPYRFTARPWELQQFPSISPHDCLGSNLYVHTRRGKVMRVVPRENPHINQTWLADRDRYSYEGLNHPERLTKPLIKKDNQWQETDWETALLFVAEGLNRILENHGADQIGMLASPNSTIEEFYLLQKLARSIGCNNIDYRLRQVDFSDDATAVPSLKFSFSELNESDVIVLIGSNIQKEQPLASVRVRNASLKGAKIIALNMLDYDFHFKLAAKKIAAPQHFVNMLLDVIEEKDHDITQCLMGAKKIVVLIGSSAFNHPEWSSINALARTFSEKNQATLGYLSEGCNAAGAVIANAIPNQDGLNAKSMLENSLKAYLLLNVEPDLDCANPPLAEEALERAEFVVSLSIFKNSLVDQVAHVILPIAPFTETAGTYVNTEIKWQSFKKIADTQGDSKSAWKVLRVLANLLNLDEFEYETAHDVLMAVKSFHENSPKNTLHPQHKKISRNTSVAHLSRIGDIPIYSGDSLVRRARALQETQRIIDGPLERLLINTRTAEALKIGEGDVVLIKQKSSISLPVAIDNRVPDHAVFIFGATAAASGLNELFGPIEIQR